MNPTTEKIIGLEQEIMLRKIQKWENLSKRELKSGRKWCQVSFSRWVKVFPLWDFKRYITAKKNLKENKIIISKTQNNKKVYTIDYKILNQIVKGGKNEVT